MQDPLYPTAKNEYEVLDDSTVRMDVGNGRFALLDLADLPLVAPYRWHSKKMGYTFYAGNNQRLPNGKGLTTLMHRVILGLPPSRRPVVDHINHDGLDNRRENLRAVTHSENSVNMRPEAYERMRKHGYLGVSRVSYKSDRPWQSRIRHKGRIIHLGVYATEEEAARVYDSYARNLRGDRAALNFPDEESHP